MKLFHIKNNSIEICEEVENCRLKHYSKPSEAIYSSSDYETSKEYISVRLFNKKINKNVGDTIHFSNDRAYRELKLKKYILTGKALDSFVVELKNEPLQIQEILDNGLMIIYSYLTHKRITMFLPTPERVVKLYNFSGLIPPSKLIETCETNRIKAY